VADLAEKNRGFDRPYDRGCTAGAFTGPAGTFRQRTEIPRTARDLLTALDIDVPRKIHELTTPET
jgi:hypothetical protein